ncbi:MAG: hypothetical protein EZS28_025663, partial [Streblomastix strix]
GEKKQGTGKLVDLTLVEDGDLCVIDFDINKNLPKEKIDEIRQNIIDNMLPANVGLVKTCHSGLHAYCNKNGYRLPNNRCIKCIVLDNIEIDIFVQMYKHKSFEDDPMQTDLVQNHVVGPNISIRETKNNVRETLKYEKINDWANMTHLANLRDILESWNVDIEIPNAEFEKLKIVRAFGQQITNDGTIDKMDDEFAQACINGLKNLTFHNYPQPITMEVSLLSIFSGIYGIVNEQRRSQGLYNIDLSDDFTLLNIQEKAANGEYENEEQIVMDLTRLLVYYEGETEDIYVIKGYNANCVTQVLHHKLEGKEYKQLEKINMNFKKKKIDEKTSETKESIPAKPLTAKHIFKKYASKFAKKGCKFISEDPKILSIFQGDMPIQLETDDRRHLVCACKTVHQVTGEHPEQTDYFKKLNQGYTQEFYENLMTYLLERDVSQFKPSLIPMTEAKKQLINVNRSPVDDVIIEHFEQFKQVNNSKFRTVTSLHE